MRKATGIRIADETALEVVREVGLPCRTRRRWKRRSCMGRVGKSAPNLPARDFEAEGPMTKLAADVAELKAGGAKLRPSPVVDPCNDEVVAYSISRSPNMKTALEVLSGLEERMSEGDAPLLHSGMGWQHRMPACRFALERMGVTQSMPRKGNCLDSAKAGIFFSMVKAELCHDREGDDPDRLVKEPEIYVDWYGNSRIKRRLNGSSPVECRLNRAA